MQLKMKRSNKSIKEINYCIEAAKQGNLYRTNREEQMIFQQSGLFD